MEIIVSKEALNGIVNFDDLKAFAKEQIAPYESLMVEEDELATAKTVVANMRRLAKAADQERIRIEREHAEKIALTKEQLKELSGIFNNAAIRIDSQVKEIISARKQAKRAEIKKYWLEKSVAIAGYITFEQIEDPKWQNASVGMATALAQVDEIVERYKVDVETLEAIDCDAATKAALKDCYIRTRSMGSVLAMKTSIDAEKARAEQKRIQEEAEKLRQIEPEKAESDAETKASVCVPSGITECDSPEKATEPEMQIGMITHTFWVTGTKEQFVALRHFLNANGMKYGKA